MLELRRRWRTIGFRFDALAVFLMCQHKGIELDELDTIPKAEYTSLWVWSAHRSYQMWRRRKDLLTLSATEKFVSTMPKKEWDEMLAVMLSTQPKGGDDKKKVPAGVNSLSQDGKPE